MKLLSVTVPALLAICASASPTFFTSGVAVGEDQYDVPGDNPLHHCQNPADDVLVITSVDLDPNPPQAGKTLTITATGVLKEDIEEGAKAHLVVKYGLIKIINQDQDLCDLVTNVDLECPLKKGELKLVKEVELPSAIPPGTYTVEANVTTKDKDEITCLQASVPFHRPGVAELFKQDM